MCRACMWPLLSVAISVAATCHAADPAKLARVAISGQVVDDQSRAVPGARVRGIAHSDLTTATTDELGRFLLNVVENRVRQLAIIAEDADGTRLGTYQAPWDDPPNAESSIEIRLAPCRDLPVQVADAQGKPAEGVRIGALIHSAALASTVTGADGGAILTLPTDAPLQTLYAVKPGEGFDYRVVKTLRDAAHRALWLDKPPVRFQLAESQTVQIQLVDAENEPIAETEVYLWLLNKPGEPDSFNLTYTPTEFQAKTDRHGVAEFRGVPNWNVHPLIFWPNHDDYVRDRIRFDPRQHPDGRLTVKLDRLATVSGHVRFADGRPAAGIDVHFSGAGYKDDSFRDTATTDVQGVFHKRAAPDLLYMVAVQDDWWAAPAIDGLVIRPDDAIEGLQFELRPATRVYGRVTLGPQQKPVAGQRMSLQHDGRDLHNLEGAELPNPKNSNRWVQPRVYRWSTTDEDGRYEFFVGPGKFVLGGPSQVAAETFRIADETELVFDFAVPRPETGPFAGRVVTGDPPRPVAAAIIVGKYRSGVGGGDLRLRADEHGRFAGERRLHTTVLRAESDDGQLAGIVEIGPDTAEATIRIGPLASATARLIDAQSQEPLADTKVIWGRRVHKGDDDAPWETAWGGTAKTDGLGRFQMTALVVGQPYSLSVPQGDGSYGGLPRFTPESAEPIDLGDLRLKPSYRPPTFEEKVDRQLATKRPAAERYDHAMQEAERLRQRVLVVFVDRDTKLTESWFKLRLDDQSVRAALHNYQLIQLDMESEVAHAMAKHLNFALNAKALPVWRFADASGQALETGQIPRLADGSTVDKAALLERLARHAPKPLDARELMRDALAAAAKSNRRVIVQETATWCGPCHRLARYLERHRAIWEKDYLWVRIDRRWHGSGEVMDRIKKGYRGGIPWYAILDAKGQVLATSDGPNGNIGFPSEPAAVDHFLSMIRSTGERLGAKELAALRAGFESQ